MQKQIIKLDRIRSINRVLQNHENAFENKPTALALRQELQQQSAAVETAINTLVRPVAIIRKPRQVSRENLRTTLTEFTGIGQAIAKSKDDVVLHSLMTTYRKQVNSASYFALCEIGRQVKLSFDAIAADAQAFGVSAERLTAFDEMISSLDNYMLETTNNLSDRRAGRSDLNSRLKSCNQLIRERLDKFVKFSRTEYPEFYADYIGVRGVVSRSKRNRTADEITYEISGTVTDKATGLPINNAIINILNLDMAATTDADGYYLIEDLAEGKYNLSCQAQGYELPVPVAVDLQDELPAQLDFALVSVTK